MVLFGCLAGEPLPRIHDIPRRHTHGISTCAVTNSAFIIILGIVLEDRGYEAGSRRKTRFCPPSTALSSSCVYHTSYFLQNILWSAMGPACGPLSGVALRECKPLALSAMRPTPLFRPQVPRAGQKLEFTTVFIPTCSGIARVGIEGCLPGIASFLTRC